VGWVGSVWGRGTTTNLPNGCRISKPRPLLGLEHSLKSNRSTCTLLGLIGLSRTRCQPHGANETSTRLLNPLALTPFPMSISAKRSVHELMKVTMKVTKKTKMLLPKEHLRSKTLKVKSFHVQSVKLLYTDQFTYQLKLTVKNN
jgi:hypothetical protein